MPYGVYTAGTAGDEVSSTYEGRHLTFSESQLIHPTHTDGFVDKGDPVIVGENIVGVAFLSAAAATDLIPIDTEGIWQLSVVATNQLGNSAVAVGDELFINKTTAVISKNSDAATHARFGYALYDIATGVTDVIPVKVHFDPDSEGNFFEMLSTDGTDRTSARSVFAYTEFDGTQTTGGGWQLINGASGLVNVDGTLYGSTTFVAGLYGQVYGSGTLTEVSHICAIWGDYAVASGVPTTGSSEILYLTCNVADAKLNSAIHIKLFPDEDCNGADSIFYFEDCYFGGASGTPIRDGGTGDKTIETGGDWKKIAVSIDGTIYWLIAMTDPTES